MAGELKPSVSTRVDTYRLCGRQLKELVKLGFHEDLFLGGTPGEGQEVHFTFEAEFERTLVVARVTTSIAE